MEVKFAEKYSDAIVSTNHPRTDYRTEEAKAYVAWVEKYLKQYVETGKTILDVGCTSGKQTFAVENLGLSATGIDCSIKSIHKAEEIAECIGSKCKFVIGDYTNTTFKENSFDYALFPNNIVECSYTEYERLIEHLLFVLKSNGRLFLTMKQGIIEKHEMLTGQNNHPIITVPNKGTFEYPTYYWSISFMNHITSKRFELKSFELIDEAKKTHLFVYDKLQFERGK